MLNWIKKNKLLTVLIVILLLLGYKLLKSGYGISPLRMGVPISSRVSEGMPADSETVGRAEPAIGIIPPTTFPEAVSDADERLVIQESNLSLLVEDVRGVSDSIINYARDQGGFMVSSSYSSPEESPFSTVVIRVPSDRFDQTLEFLRVQAAKVTNENLVGEDVTAQYTDIEARIETLEATKDKFEDLLSQTNNIDQIIRIQRELINIQSQIDHLVGQRDALEKNAEFTKITVYLSTDEIALPYTPDEAFRPSVIFKLAVRSLVSFIRDLARVLIWAAVYAVIWLPVVLGILFFKRLKK